MKRLPSTSCRVRFEARLIVLNGLLLTTVLLELQLRADEFAADLPEGVRAVWNVGKTFHETTPTRERICLNGLWRWQPADTKSELVPSNHWGFFKVPGCWPGITDYMQKDFQTIFTHPSWKNVKPGTISAAWYERDFSVPTDWTGR